MNTVMNAINDFMATEYWSGTVADFSDLDHVDLVYTQSLDGEHNFQWYADLNAKELILEIDEVEEIRQDFASYDEMSNYILSLGCGELMTDADAYYENIWLKRNNHENH